MNVSTPEAVQLLHEGSIALADVERNGVRVDLPYLKGAIAEIETRIKELEGELLGSKTWAAWKRRHGDKSQLGSYPQLADLVYGDLGYECTSWTTGGASGRRRPRVDKTVLEKIDHPFVRRWVRMQKLRKASSTYLVGLLREVVAGRIHPVFNLHLVETYRSSASDPNIQNQPNRDQEIAEIIRRSFVASDDDHVFLEIDLSQAEVRCSACYNDDPNLIRYVSGGGDMHFDTGMELFLLSKEQMTGFKGARQAAKNQYVFPSFYGSYYAQTAPGLWDYVGRNSLKLPDGTCLYSHLESKGIRALGDCAGNPAPGTFEAHVQKVERKFWGERFAVYDQWKRDWWEAYQRDGGFWLLTGFWVEGIMGRNECINTPVQGAAFHWLLWSLIQVNRWLRKNRMRSKIVGQVHDSLLIDCHKDELQDVLTKAKQVFTVDLPRHWRWINVPVVVEAEASPPGGSWFEKKHVEI